MSHGNKNASATKSGPGRFHKQGHQKAGPIKHEGAPSTFTLHKASAAKKERRALVAAHGRRQALKAIKYWRSEDRLAKKIEADESAAADIARGYDEEREAAYAAA